MITQHPAVTVAAAAFGATIVVLSAASMSNMYETYVLVHHHRQRLQSPRELPSSLPAVVSKSKSWESVDETIEALSIMNKRELVDLFLHCEPPTIPFDLVFCDGGQDWRYDGYLLDNGPILTPVTNFITNNLFGRGQPWLGKAYFTPSSFTSTIATTAGMGKNIFRQRPQKMLPMAAGELLDRTFDYSIESSVLSSMSSKSLFNRYASHCRAGVMSSIWRGMVDELRVIAPGNGSKKAKDKVILGMGYFSWSGGVWNLAPFCLVARMCEKKTIS